LLHGRHTCESYSLTCEANSSLCSECTGGCHLRGTWSKASAPYIQRTGSEMIYQCLGNRECGSASHTVHPARCQPRPAQAHSGVHIQKQVCAVPLEICIHVGYTSCVGPSARGLLFI
jgi:hypothetical protein